MTDTAVMIATVHASCVAIDGHAVLIEGLSGAGKSDLALRLIDRGATLVADDYTMLRREGDRLIATAPATIAGMIEVRGLGILPFPYEDGLPVALLITLGGAVERMPDDAALRSFGGVSVPVMPLAGFEASAPIKVELALRRAAREVER
jgi:serine kinase of HPr protein (carbohydrate metabolism regulator)